MKPWMGAIAAAVAIAAAPSAAFADDGVSVVAVQAAQQGGDRDVRGARSRPRPRLQARPGRRRARQRGRHACRAGTLPGARLPGRQDPSDTGLRRRAARRARGDDRRPRTPLPDALTSAAAKRAKSAAAGTVRAQRADFWEDVSGAYLSIEGSTTRGHDERQRLHGPAARRRVVRRRRHATRHRQPVGADRRGPVPLPRLALPGRRPRHRRCRPASASRRPTATSPRWPSSAGPTAAAPRAPAASSRTSSRTTSRRARPTRRSACSSSEFPDTAELLKLPNKTNGYQRKAQTVIGNGTPLHGPVDDRQLRLGRRPDVRRLGP